MHVLLVEDNPGDVRLIEEGVADSDVESSLTAVTDGESALDYLYRRNGYESEPRPDLVLLDLNLPRLNGRAVLEAIETDSELRSPPVAVLSSSKTEDDVRETYELGADGYYVKPVDPNEFIATVRTVVESLADSGRLPAGKYADVDPAR